MLLLFAIFFFYVFLSCRFPPSLPPPLYPPLADMKSAAEDMALLGSCSHSVMTVGSYGFWASFFAGGQVVYPLIVNCSVTPFVHPDSLGPLDYDNFKPFDINGGGPV